MEIRGVRECVRCCREAAYDARHDTGGQARQDSIMIEIIGLVARIAFGVLVEVVWFWEPSDRPRYRDYVRTLPPGEKPLTKREWRAVERSRAREAPHDSV